MGTRARRRRARRLAASQCTPSAPASAASRPAAPSRTSPSRPEDLRRARRPRRVLHVLVGRPLRADLRLRPAVDAPPLDDPGVHARIPATGYGFDDDSKTMLGDLTWGDAHHPALSETKGDYDGRWLFINEMNGRVARIDLRDFKTKQILGPDPQRLRQPRLVVRHAQHRVRDDGLALLDPDAARARWASTSTPPTTRASSPA